MVTIALDGQLSTITALSPGGYRGQALLFSNTGLSNISHTLVITGADAEGLYTTVDRIMYLSGIY